MGVRQRASVFSEQTDQLGRNVRQARATPRDEVQMAWHGQLLDLHLGEVAAVQFPAHAHPGHDGHAHAHLHEAFDALDGRQLDLHVQRRAVAREEFDNPAAKGRFNNVSDEDLFADVRDIHGAASSQGVLRRDHQSQLVAENFQGMKLRLARDIRNGA